MPASQILLKKKKIPYSAGKTFLRATDKYPVFTQKRAYQSALRVFNHCKIKDNVKILFSCQMEIYGTMASQGICLDC